MFEIAIFDWDGTLANTKKVIVASFQRALKEINCNPNDKLIERLIGIGSAQTFRKILEIENIIFNEALIESLVRNKVKNSIELSGEIAGITIIDDYAHHPTEIRATLNAARNRFPGRPLWAIWQPHTYSRTEVLFEEYLNAFEEADHVLVTEIFASREPVNEEFSSLQVVQSMSHPDVHFLATNDQVSTYLISNLQEGDVLLVLSAGDAYQISERVIGSLSRNGNSEHG